MKSNRIVSAVLAVLGFLLAAVTVVMLVIGLRAAPVMLTPPAGAADCARTLMDAVCSGNNAAASAELYGKPSLGSVPEDASSAAAYLWDAYHDNLEYHFDGDCYATESGAAINVTVRALDLPTLLKGLDSRAQTLLEQKKNKNQAELFGADGQLLPEQADRILTDAVLLALGEEKPFREQKLTLSLTYDAGQWWVIPEEELLNVLSGSFAV